MTIADVNLSNYSAEELITYGDSYAVTAFEKALAAKLKEVIAAPRKGSELGCGEYCDCCGSPL